jgi:hypothetical protein
VGPRPPVQITTFADFDKRLQRLNNALLIVIDRFVLDDIEADRGQLLGQPTSVGIDELSASKLSSYRKNSCRHDGG